MAGTRIAVEIELSADEEKLLEEYLDAHCLDRDKWFKRMVYHYFGTSLAISHNVRRLDILQ